MLLQRLREYAEAGRVEGMAPEGYLVKAVRYVIELDNSGQVLGFIDQAQGEGSRDKRGKLTAVPEQSRNAFAVRPRLFADDGEYTLGKQRAATATKKATTSERLRQLHEAYVSLVRECASTTNAPAVGAVATFLDDASRIDPYLPQDFDPSAIITFRVDEILPVDLPSVRQYWARHLNPQADLEDPGQDDDSVGERERHQCIVCGQTKPAMKRLAYKWKGIHGGQSSGLALISADTAAFESYGLEKSFIAPTCAECGELFSKAANDLLAKDATRLRIGPLTYIFWTRDEVDFNFGALITDPEPQQVRALLKAPDTGQRAAVEIDESPFYAAIFSASGGRVAVRDWLDTTVGVAKMHLARYFRLQEVVGRYGAEATPLGIRVLAGATVRDPSKDPAPPQVTRLLLSVALKGGPVSRHLLYEAVRRCRAGSGVTQAQAALIKMVMLSEQEQVTRRESVTDQELVQLDLQNRAPAYLCGRLLAVLEATQRAALGDVNATIVDRYFGTASSAPASVFARLIRGAQSHLSKLRRDPRKRGAYFALQDRLMSIMNDTDGLRAFPPTLTLIDQGLFALGYYHQRAADRAAARNNTALTALVTNPEDDDE